MLTTSDVNKAVYVVRASGAAAKFDAIRDSVKKKAGRTSGLTSEIFLVGLLLAAMTGKGMILTDVHKLLTKEMPFDKQRELGIRRPGSLSAAFSVDSVDRMMCSFLKAVEFGRGSAPALDPDTRAHRHALLMDMLNAMIDTTLLTSTSDYLALDSTGIWSFGRNPGKTGVKALKADIERLKAEGNDDDATILQYYLDLMVDQEATKKPDSAKGKGDGGELMIPGRGYDPDARSSGKTGKDGKTEWYYGYELHALVRTADPSASFAGEPNLIVRFDVTPAGRGVIKASQGLLDMLPECERTRYIVADRLYSNLTEENWYTQLIARDLRQVVDMRGSDQAWTDVDGMRVTAGSCHCPATPDHLVSIPKGSFGVTDEFRESIAERFAYATQLKEDNGLRRRVVCPALAGKLRCHRRPETLTMGADLPLVESPPDAATAPSVCTQASVVVHASNPNAKGRLWQPKYWGIDAQLKQWDRRTAVEQVFGKRKARYGTNMTRGFVRIPGLAAFTLAVGMVVIAGNIRDVEAWVTNGHQDARDEDHPLLQVADDFVVLHVDLDQALAFETFKDNQDAFADFLAAREAAA